MTRIAFFNNKGGVGKTSLVYHLSWMFADLGLRVVAADLDPQANLTSMFLTEERLEALWPDTGRRLSIFGAIAPLTDGTGDIENDPHMERIGENIGLLPGDLQLSAFESELVENWTKCVDSNVRAFRIISAFSRLLDFGEADLAADISLIDVGPNLGAINRAALIASDVIVTPLGPDLFSLQGLRNLGPAIRRWRQEWEDRLARGKSVPLNLPEGRMAPSGYVMMRHSMRLDRPVKAYAKWIDRVPKTYRTMVLDEPVPEGLSVANDPYCLAQMKDYRSLMPMAQESNKPMFFLKPADGAFGGLAQSVQDCYGDFEKLARRIAGKAGVPLPN